MKKRYENCATRLESRGDDPPTKEYVDALVEFLRESGVEACWHSAVSQQCRALFPSKIFPNCHKNASLQAFHYLIRRVHELGRPIISWYSLNHCIGLVEAHPDWQMIPMPAKEFADKPANDNPRIYCCINSPYGKLLPRFAAEVVTEVGFDGLWFDGSTFAAHGNSIPGCLCSFCRDRFRHDTGLDLPGKPDFSSRAFKVWINWRYERLMEVWKRIVDAVLAVKPEATICFNNYRRLSPVSGWVTGIPMRRLGWDVVMAGELALRPFNADFQMKMHRAYGCGRGVESWMNVSDHWRWAPDVESLPQKQAAVAAIAAGGVASSGIGIHPKYVTEPMKAMQKAAKEIMPYLNGEPVPYAAIWASQQTQDFYGKLDTMPLWEACHAANEFCLQSHLQSSVIFDDEVREGNLSIYPVLIAGNAACLDRRQAENLRRYAEKGGVLVACHEFGAYDEWGAPYKKPLFEDLIGISSRKIQAGRPTLRILDQKMIRICGHYMSFRGVPYSVVKPIKNARIYAECIDRKSPSWNSDDPKLLDNMPSFPAVWSRKYGRGNILYFAPDAFQGYQDGTTLHMMRFFRELLVNLVAPAITLEGPVCVTMNTRCRPDGSWFVHLHNAPGMMFRYANPAVFNSVEILPVFDLKIRLKKGKVKKAFSGLTGKKFKLADNNRTICIPRLDRNDVIVIHW